MSRSVYSLVLADDVVRQIDRAAYARNTSRSNLINQILADYVSYTTPEMRMKSIFDQMLKVMEGEGCFRIQPQPSDAMLSVCSALQFKYNPTIRYSVELYRDAEVSIGELRVVSRSKSRPLLQYLDRFFRGFVEIERQYRPVRGDESVYKVEEGRFYRKFILSQEHAGMGDGEIGSAIAQYIRYLDKMINVYFAAANTSEAAAGQALEQVERIYQEYLSSGTAVL